MSYARVIAVSSALVVAVLAYTWYTMRPDPLADAAEAVREHILKSQHQAFVWKRPAKVQLTAVKLPGGVTLDLARSKGLDESGSLAFDPRKGKTFAPDASILLRSAAGEVWVDVSAGTGMVKVRR